VLKQFYAAVAIMKKSMPAMLMFGRGSTTTCHFSAAALPLT
jgi:hypothetical protein